MSKLKCFILSLAFVLSLTAGKVFADEGGFNNTFSIGPRATYVNSPDVDENKWFGGAQFRIKFAPVIGVEASADYFEETFANSATKVKIVPLQGSMLFYLTPSYALSPILLGGAGWYYTRVEGPAGFSDTTYRFGVHVGAGLELKLGDSFSVDSTWRKLWIESIASKDVNTLSDKKYNDSGYMVTIGLNFMF